MTHQDNQAPALARASATPQTAPVRIAGAGPSGLAAAITLARAGRRVEVFEARPAVGHRFIGDFQVLENASTSRDGRDLLAAIGVDAHFVELEPAHDAVLFDHRLRPIEVSSTRPYGYFLRRGPEPGTLDTGLLAQARELGVTVHFGRRVASSEVDLVATGPPMADGLAREMTFTTSLSDRTWVLFDQELAPGGYAYLFVRRGYATYGAAIVRDFPSIDRRFADCLARFQELEPFNPSAVRHGYSYMNFTLPGSRPGSRPGSQQSAASGATAPPHVGEAGGFQDYLFGLGIRFALTTGWLAGRAAVEGLDYDVLCEREVGQLRRSSVVNRMVYELGGNFGLALFTRRARGRDFGGYLAAWHAYPLWKRLLLPLLLASWRRQEACRHHLDGHWCRRAPPARSTRSQEVTAAGGAQGRADVAASASFQSSTGAPVELGEILSRAPQ